MAEIIDVNPPIVKDNNVEIQSESIDTTTSAALFVKSILCNKIFLGFMVFLIIAVIGILYYMYVIRESSSSSDELNNTTITTIPIDTQTPPSPPPPQMFPVMIGDGLVLYARTKEDLSRCGPFINAFSKKNQASYDDFLDEMSDEIDNAIEDEPQSDNNTEQVNDDTNQDVQNIE